MGPDYVSFKLFIKPTQWICECHQWIVSIGARLLTHTDDDIYVHILGAAQPLFDVES